MKVTNGATAVFRWFGPLRGLAVGVLLGGALAAALDAAMAHAFSCDPDTEIWSLERAGVEALDGGDAASQLPLWAEEGKLDGQDLVRATNEELRVRLDPPWRDVTFEREPGQ